MNDKELMEKCLLTDRELINLPRNSTYGQTEIAMKAQLKKAIPIIRQELNECWHCLLIKVNSEHQKQLKEPKKAVAKEIKRELEKNLIVPYENGIDRNPCLALRLYQDGSLYARSWRESDWQAFWESHLGGEE